MDKYYRVTCFHLFILQILLKSEHILPRLNLNPIHFGYKCNLWTLYSKMLDVSFFRLF